MQTRTTTLGTDQERAVTVEIRMVIQIRYQRNKEYAGVADFGGPDLI